MRGLGAQDTERPRIAYLPEDEEYWGTSGDVLFNSIGSPNAFGSHVPDPVEAEMPGAGIGVIGGHRQAAGVTLADAVDLLLKATQGTGRGLQDLGINLPAVVPLAD